MDIDCLALEDDCDIQENMEVQNITFMDATRKIIKYSLPTMATYIFQTLIDFTNMYFIGRMGSPNYIGGFGLGMMWTNVACLSFLIGLTSALETMCSQAFGKKDFKLLGSIHNKAQVILFFVSLPLSLLLYNCNHILCFLGMETKLAELAASFTRIYIPSAFILAQYEVTKKYMQTHQIFIPPMVINIITSALHPFWCKFLMGTLSNKFTAIGHAKNITNVISYIALIAYIKISGCCSKSWSLPGRESFKEWKPFLKLGVYGAAFTCLEWWAFEVINILSGYIESTSLAASIGLSNINLLFAMIPFGIGMATTTLIGNSLGELSAFNAKVFAKASVIVNGVIILVCSSLLILFSRYVSYFFTEDASVGNMIIKLIPLLALEEVFDTTQTILGKVIVGMGKQEHCSKIALIVYYAILLPMAYVLGIRWKRGVLGLWEATTIGMALLTLSYGYVILTSSWEKIVEEVREYLTMVKQSEKSICMDKL